MSKGDLIRKSDTAKYITQIGINHLGKVRSKKRPHGVSEFIRYTECIDFGILMTSSEVVTGYTNTIEYDFTFGYDITISMGDTFIHIFNGIDMVANMRTSAETNEVFLFDGSDDDLEVIAAQLLVLA